MKMNKKDAFWYLWGIAVFGTLYIRTKPKPEYEFVQHIYSGKADDMAESLKDDYIRQGSL